MHHSATRRRLFGVLPVLLTRVLALCVTFGPRFLATTLSLAVVSSLADGGRANCTSVTFGRLPRRDNDCNVFLAFQTQNDSLQAILRRQHQRFVLTCLPRSQRATAKVVSDTTASRRLEPLCLYVPCFRSPLACSHTFNVAVIVADVFYVDFHVQLLACNNTLLA